MTVEILSPSEPTSLPVDQQLRAFYRLRAKSFGHLWDGLTIENGMECDQFDWHPPKRATYLVLVEEGEVVAGLRLLPMIGSNLINDVFPHTLPDPLPFDPKTAVECSRVCTRSPNRRRKTATLFLELHRYCVANGIRTIVGVLDPSMDRVYRGAGLPMTIMYDGGDILSAYFTIG